MRLVRPSSTPRSPHDLNAPTRTRRRPAATARAAMKRRQNAGDASLPKPPARALEVRGLWHSSGADNATPLRVAHPPNRVQALQPHSHAHQRTNAVPPAQGQRVAATNSGLVCTQCGATETPQWREGPLGELCMHNSGACQAARSYCNWGLQPLITDTGLHCWPSRQHYGICLCILARPSSPVAAAAAGVKTLCNACGVKWYRQSKATRKARTPGAKRSPTPTGRTHSNTSPAHAAPSPRKRSAAGESGDDELTSERSVGARSAQRVTNGGMRLRRPPGRAANLRCHLQGSSEDELEHDAAMSLLSFAGMGLPGSAAVNPDAPVLGATAHCSHQLAHASAGAAPLLFQPTPQATAATVAQPAACIKPEDATSVAGRGAEPTAASLLNCLLRFLSPADLMLLNQLQAGVRAARESAAAADVATAEASARLAAMRGAAANAHARVVSAEAMLRGEAERLLAMRGAHAAQGMSNNSHMTALPVLLDSHAANPSLVDTS
eukprot:363378-Chlamydomonas_euryale.AAC.46